MGSPDARVLTGEHSRLMSLLEDDGFGSLLYLRRERSAVARDYGYGLMEVVSEIESLLHTGP